MGGLTMRRLINLNKNWTFNDQNGGQIPVDVPHTWNNLDGQDGGNDYYRGTLSYDKVFDKPEYDSDTEDVYLQFQGVNASATVVLNGDEICRHDGGYSTFRVRITDTMKETNSLRVYADNSRNELVYPQKADFTFYGGIYRDVDLVIVNKNHFDMDYYGGTGCEITPTVKEAEPTVGELDVKAYVTGTAEHVRITLYDAAGSVVADSKCVPGSIGLDGADKIAINHAKDTTVGECSMVVDHIHLWDGITDPYLYSVKLELIVAGQVVDEITSNIGFRYFSVDAKKGFCLNGRSYPLRGVSRHQDRKGIGNALTREMHDQDMALIAEMGCNTIRLAHYQHDQYFYDLCDRYGMVVWAEIPYISSHMNSGRENTISQMKELVYQNYNHPSIVCWGVSNEITIQTKDKKDMLDNHHVLNDMLHAMDPTRFTTLACYAMCGPFNPVAHITDVVSWNLYLGWYVPGLFLNNLWVGFFHLVYPGRALGFSEYGAESMTTLHSSHPRRGDHTEEYQAVYHEYMARFFEKRPWMWAAHVWNMFDFAADARDQGGEPGMNHKGLVTFDREIKKDSYYVYKAFWSDQPFAHIASKRYVDRPESTIKVKVYTNLPEVELYVDDKLIEKKAADRIVEFAVPISGEHKVRAVAKASDGTEYEDEAVFRKVDAPNPAYKLSAKSSNSANWV